MNDGQAKKSTLIAWGLFFVTWYWFHVVVGITVLVMSLAYDTVALGMIIDIFWAAGPILGAWSAFNYWGGTTNAHTSVMGRYVRWCLVRPWFFLVPGWMTAFGAVFLAVSGAWIVTAFGPTTDGVFIAGISILAVTVAAHAVICIKTGHRLRTHNQEDQINSTNPFSKIANFLRAVFSLKIHRAAALNDVKTIDWLIQRGTDVNTKEDDGETPLLVAAVFGSTEAADLLIKKGADVNAAIDDMTPLFVAASENAPGVAALLIQAGVDVNTKHIISGGTPLHFAAGRNAAEVAALLIEKGADVNAMDYAVRTPLLIAETKGSNEVAALLKQAGGRF